MVPGAGTAAAFAQGNRGAAAAAPSFASVDVQRLLSEYKVRQQSSQEVEGLRQNLSRALQRLDQGGAAFLGEAKLRELARLYEKASPTDDDRKRITALEGESAGLNDELTRLQNKAAPSDQEKARLAELSNSQQKGRDVLQTLQTDYEQRLQARNGELLQKITNDVKAAIAKVAQDKNVAVVFDAAVAVYTANDITGDVIKHLNR
jgi:Skp family chaperone for outer membrane proteins